MENPITYYIAQFLITFGLAWAATYSLITYTRISAALLGIIAIPVILLLLAIGDGWLWQSIGNALQWLGTNTFTALQSSFRSVPILTTGVVLGVLYGLGIRP